MERLSVATAQLLTISLDMEGRELTRLVPVIKSTMHDVLTPTGLVLPLTPLYRPLSVTLPSLSLSLPLLPLSLPGLSLPLSLSLSIF